MNNQMTSKYGLISIADLVSEVKLPFNTYVDSSSNRVYSDTDIEATISNAERLVCGWLDNQGLTSSTAHDLIIYAVTLLSSILSVYLRIFHAKFLFHQDSFDRRYN